MGKSTRLKLQKEQEAEDRVKYSFARHNFELREKKEKAEEIKPYAPLFKYQHLWLNDPSTYTVKTKSKDPTKLLLEYVRFTFGKYRVCPALTNVWVVSAKEQRNLNQAAITNVLFCVNTENFGPVDLRTWYICVATGGSLAKVHAKDILTRKEVHCLVTCPHDIEPRQALVYSVAKAAGANEGIALRLARAKFAEKTFTAFWRSVIRFFAVNEAASIAEVNDLIDYIQYEHALPANEYENGVLVATRQPFTMAGKTIEGLKKKMVDWHYAMRRVKVMGNHSWDGAYLPDEEFETRDSQGNKAFWRFAQIKTSKALAAEGTAQRHCVYSYRDRCIHGDLSIWSLQRRNQYGVYDRKITIELRNDGRIAQARGVANRAPNADEYNVIKRWAQQNGLNFNTYY